MLKHLISLVFLFITFLYSSAYTDTNSIILPKTKPKKISISIKEDKLTTILPAEKPQLEKKLTNRKKNILPKNKPQIKKVVKKVEKIKSKTSIKPISKPVQKEKVASSNLVDIENKKSFVFPEKKPVTYQKNFK